MADEIFVGKLLVDDSQLQETFQKSGEEIADLKGKINNFMSQNEDSGAVGMVDKFAQVNAMLQQIDSSVNRASKIFSNSTNLIDSEGALRSLQVIKTSMDHTFADLKTTMSESLAFTTEIGIDNITKMDKAMKPYLGRIRKSMMKEAADWRSAGRANLTDEEFTSYFMKSDDYKNILSQIKTGDNARLFSPGNMRSYIKNVVAANLPQYLRADFNPNLAKKTYPESFEASLPGAFKNMPRDSFSMTTADAKRIAERQAENNAKTRLTEKEFKFLENLALKNRYAQDALVDAGVFTKANGRLFRVNNATRERVNFAGGNIMELIVAGAKGQAGDKINVDDRDDWMSTIRYRTNQKYVNVMSAAQTLSDNLEWLVPSYGNKITIDPNKVLKDRMSGKRPKYTYSGDIENGIRQDQFKSNQYVYTLNNKGEIVIDESGQKQNYIGDSIHLRTLGYNPDENNGAEIANKMRYIKIGDKMSKLLVEEQDKIMEAKRKEETYEPSSEYTAVRNWLVDILKNGQIDQETGITYGVSRMNMHADEGVIELVERGLLDEAIARDPKYFTGGYENGHVFRKGEYGKFARAIDNMNRNASDAEDIRRMLGVDTSNLKISAIDFSKLPGLKNFDGINYISNRLTTQGFQGRGKYIKGTFSPLSMDYLFDLYKDKIETDDSGKEFLTLPSVGGQTTRIYRDTDAIIDLSTQKANEEFKDAQGKWLSPAEIEEKIRSDFKDKGAMVMKTYKEGNTGSQWIGHQMANTFALDDEARKYFLKVFQNNMRLLDTEEGARALIFGGDPDVDIKSDIAQERIAETKLSWLKQFSEGDLMLPAANSMMYGMAGAWPVNAFNAAFRYLGKNITDEQKELELADKDVLWNLSGANELMLGRWPHAYNGSQKVINVLSKNGNKEKADRFAEVMKRAGMDANGLYISPTSPILQYMQSEDFDGDLNTIIELTNGRDEEFSRIMLSIYSKTLEQDAKERATNPNAVSENAQKRRAALRSINPFADDPNKTWSLDSAEDKADYILNSLSESRKMGLASAVSARTQQLGRSALTIQAKIDAANHYDKVSTWHKDMEDWALTKEEKAILAYGPLLGEIYKQMNNAMVEGTVTDEYGVATKTIGFDKDKFFSGNVSNFDKMNFASINSPSDLLRMMTAANLRNAGIDPNQGYDFNAMLKSLPTFATEEETALAKRIRGIRMDMAQYKYLGLSDKTISELDEMIASTKKAVRADIIKNNPNMSPKEVDYAVAQRLKLTGAEVVENTKEFGWTKRNMGLEKNRDMANSARYAAEAYGIQILDDGTVPESFDTMNDLIIEQRAEVRAARQRLEEEKKAEEEAIKNARSQREKQKREKKEQEQQETNQKPAEQVKSKEQTEPKPEVSNDNKAEQENPEKNETQEESTAKPEEDKASEKSIREIFNEKARELYNRYQNKELDREQFAKEIYSLYDAVGEDPFSASDIELDIESIIKNKGEMPAEFGFVDELISENDEVKKAREAREAAAEEVMGEETKLASLLPAGEIGNAIASQNKALEYGEYLDSLSNKYASKYFKYYMEGMSGNPYNSKRFNPWMSDELSLIKSYQKIREEEAAGVDDATLNANRLKAEQAKAEFDSALRMAAPADLAEAAEYFGNIGDYGSITKKYDKQIQAVRDTLATKSNAYDVLHKRELEAKKEGRPLSEEDQEALRQAKEQKLRAEQEAADAELRLNNLRDEEIDKKSFDMMSKARAYSSSGLFGRYSSQAETGFRNRKDLFFEMQKHYKDLDPNSAEGKNFAKAMDKLQGRLARESDGKRGEIGNDLGFMGKVSGITNSLMSRFSYRIFMTIINSIKKFVKEIWNAAKEYDAAMVAIASASGKSLPEVNELGEKFKSMAPALNTTTLQLLKFAQELYNLDFSDLQIFKYIEDISNFTKLTGSSATDSGKLIKEAESADYSYEKIANSAYSMGEGAYKNINVLTDVLYQLGTSAKEQGTDEKQITSFVLAAAENGNTNGANIGKALESSYRRIGDIKSNETYITDKSGEKTSERTDDINSVLSQYVDTSMDTFDILTQLASSWSSYSQTDRQIISSAVAGENAKEFSEMMDSVGKNGGEQLTRNLNDAKDGENSMEEDLEKRKESLTGSIDELKNTWQEFLTAFQDNEVIKSLVDMCNDFVLGLKYIASSVPATKIAIISLIAILVTLATVMNVIKYGWGGLALTAAMLGAAGLGFLGIGIAASSAEKQNSADALNNFNSENEKKEPKDKSVYDNINKKYEYLNNYEAQRDKVNNLLNSSDADADVLQREINALNDYNFKYSTSNMDGFNSSVSSAAQNLYELGASAKNTADEIINKAKQEKAEAVMREIKTENIIPDQNNTELFGRNLFNSTLFAGMDVLENTKITPDEEMSSLVLMNIGALKYKYLTEPEFRDSIKFDMSAYDVYHGLDELTPDSDAMVHYNYETGQYDFDIDKYLKRFYIDSFSGYDLNDPNGRLSYTTLHNLMPHERVDGAVIYEPYAWDSDTLKHITGYDFSAQIDDVKTKLKGTTYYSGANNPFIGYARALYEGHSLDDYSVYGFTGTARTKAMLDKERNLIPSMIFEDDDLVDSYFAYLSFMAENGYDPYTIMGLDKYNNYEDIKSHVEQDPEFNKFLEGYDSSNVISRNGNYFTPAINSGYIKYKENNKRTIDWINAYNATENMFPNSNSSGFNALYSATSINQFKDAVNAEENIVGFKDLINSSPEVAAAFKNIGYFDDNGNFQIKEGVTISDIRAAMSVLNKQTGVYDDSLSKKTTAVLAQKGLKKNGYINSDGTVNEQIKSATESVIGVNLSKKAASGTMNKLESKYSENLVDNALLGISGISENERLGYVSDIYRIANREKVKGYEDSFGGYMNLSDVINTTDPELLSAILNGTEGMQDYVNMSLALSSVESIFDENGNVTEEAAAALEEAGYSVEAYRMAQEDLDTTLKTSSSVAMKEYGRSTDAVNDVFKNLKGTAQQANSVVKNLNQNISSGASLEYTKGRFAKGVQTEEDYEAAASALGWDKKQLKELFTPEQIVDMLNGSLEASYEATDEAVNGWFDVVEEQLSANGGTIDIQGPDFNMQPGQVYGLAEASRLAIAAGQDELAATLSALEGMGAEAFLEVIQGDDGKIKLQFKTNSYGGGSKGSGGGGGGKSQVQKLIDKLKHERELTDHWLKMINYDETLYENRGQYANENRLINIENEYRQTTQIPQLEQQLVQLKEKFSSTKVESDDWYSLRQEIQSTEEALSEARNSIDDNTRKIQENMQKIAKTRSDMEDAVTGEFDTRLEEAKNQLNAEVDMQNTILEAIKQRYQDEWDLQKEDMERKKQALQDEISMIDERLNARKEAADESSKYEELAELRRQYALISMNEARSKDAAEIAEKIKDLEEEIGWDIAEDEAEAQKQALQEESDSIDTRMTEGDKDLENLLSDANNFSDEVNSVLMMNQEDLFAWLKANVQEYSNSLDEAQSQMVIGWTETYQQMKEIAYAFWNELTGTMELADAETYWEKIISPFVENDALFAALMMDSTQFKNASDAQQYQMLYEWGLLEGQEYEGLVNNYHNAHLNDATFEHSDEWAKIIETVKQSITSSSTGRRYSENPLMENPFGSNVDALKAYQSANGLTPDGVWGKYTQYVWEQQHKSGDLVDKEALTELSVYDTLKTDEQTKYTILDTNKNAVDEVIKKNEGTNIVTMFGDLSPEAAMSLIQSYATAGTIAADIYRNTENVVARAVGKETAEKAKDIVGYSGQYTTEEGSSTSKGGESSEGGERGSTNLVVYDPNEQSRLQAIVDADPLTEDVKLVAFDENGNYNPHLVPSESVVPSDPIIESAFKNIQSLLAPFLYDIKSYLEDNTKIVLFDENGESNPHTVFVPEIPALRTSDPQRMQEQAEKDAAYAEMMTKIYSKQWMMQQQEAKDRSFADMMTEIYSKQWEDWNEAADDIKRNDRVAAEEAAYMSATHTAEQEYYGRQYEEWLAAQQHKEDDDAKRNDRIAAEEAAYMSATHSAEQEYYGEKYEAWLASQQKNTGEEEPKYYYYIIGGEGYSIEITSTEDKQSSEILEDFYSGNATITNGSDKTLTGISNPEYGGNFVGSVVTFGDNKEQISSAELETIGQTGRYDGALTMNEYSADQNESGVPEYGENTMHIPISRIMEVYKERIEETIAAKVNAIMNDAQQSSEGIQSQGIKIDETEQTSGYEQPDVPAKPNPDIKDYRNDPEYSNIIAELAYEWGADYIYGLPAKDLNDMVDANISVNMAKIDEFFGDGGKYISRELLESEAKKNTIFMFDGIITDSKIKEGYIEEAMSDPSYWENEHGQFMQNPIDYLQFHYGEDAVYMLTSGQLADELADYSEKSIIAEAEAERFYYSDDDANKKIVTPGTQIMQFMSPLYEDDPFFFDCAEGFYDGEKLVDTYIREYPDQKEFAVTDNNGKEYGKIIVNKDGSWEFVMRPSYGSEYVQQYANGGLVDFTGPAWVDGTPQQPESFLDATDTKLLRAMLDAFNYVRVPMMSKIDSSMFNNSSNSIGEVSITLNEAQFNTDDDYDLIAQKVGESFTRELSKQGFSTANINF